MKELVMIDMEDAKKIEKSGISVNILREVDDTTTNLDIIVKSDYIGTKVWDREDVASVLKDMDIPYTTANIDRVVNTGLLKALCNPNNTDWDIICDAIEDTKDLERNPVTLEELVCDEGKIFRYAIEGDYFNTYGCIMPKDSTDISGAMEETLRLLIDKGLSDDDIHAQTGMEKTDDYNEDDIIIDLGYVIRGAIYPV